MNAWRWISFRLRFYQGVAKHKTEKEFVNSQGIRTGGTKGGARQPHKRLPYCIKVNRTSLDHLLLGKKADVDKNVAWPDYNAGSRRCQNKRFLNI